MRVVRRMLLAVAVLLVIALVGGYWYARPLLFTGTGYAAHNACAVRFVAGRSDPASDLPPNPLVPSLRTYDDQGGRSAGTSVLGVLAGQRAWYTPGYGCTLGGDRPSYPQASAIDAAANPFATAAAPTPDPAVGTAMHAAFGDDLGEADRRRLGTRAVVVLRDGRLIAQRYAAGFDAATPQLGWSMAKSVTSLLAGRLVLAGKLTLADDRLRPEWTDARAGITVEQLLRITSGLSWDETYDLGTPITEMLYRQGDMAGYVAGRRAAHPPGTYQQYSSGNTNLLCGLLRQRAGAGPDLPRTLLLGPLGLARATWEADGSGTPVCSSYLWATPREWAAIGQFALQDGVWAGRRLLPAGWVARTTTVTDVPGEERGYAAGWWVNRLPGGGLVDPRLPADAYWAQGHDGQRLVVVPSARLVVVRLGFSPGVTEADLRTSRLVADLGPLNLRYAREPSASATGAMYQPCWATLLCEQKEVRHGDREHRTAGVSRSRRPGARVPVVV